MKTAAIGTLAMASLASAVIYPTPEMFRSFMAAGGADTTVTGSETFPQLRTKMIQRVKSWSEKYISTHDDEVDMVSADDDYPYFNFIPQYQGSAVAGQEAVSWEGLCFKTNTAKAIQNQDGTVTLTVTASDPKSLTCSDYYAFLTTTGIDFQKVFFRGDHTFTWSLPSDATSSDAWDFNTNGIRMYMFQNSFMTSIKNALTTALLFESEVTQGVNPRVAARNLDFMEKYTGFTMPPRSESDNVVVDESLIKSGDFFGVIRLDGLDPILAWAMGSTTGHTTVAMWMDGELYVAESTVADSYWPTDGIQRTPYRLWVEQAKAAGYNTVWVPLRDDLRANFNEQAAIDFFRSTEGLEYGYQTLLWGWLDTLVQNYPCLPPDYSSQCLQWEFIETVFANIDRVIPDIANLLWIQGWNKRVGTDGLRTTAIYQTAANQGIALKSIPTIVEQDSWDYKTIQYQNTTVVGKSQVCCVFVCNIWKEAGVFGDMEVNCGELTNVDDYSMNIFQGEYKQITGEYTLSLNNFNSREPYEHMNEHCESLAPEYVRTPGC